MEEVKHEKCKRCKCWRIPSSFLNAKGRKLKSCTDCRERNKQLRENNKCEHNRYKSICKECGGASICEHNRQKSTCKECGGASICEHNRRRSRCKECGGSEICEHNRIMSICKECGGSEICEHNKRRSTCKECDKIGYLSNIVRTRTLKALKRNKTKRTMEYLQCTIEEFKIHIEKQFIDGMTWENQGEWQIDHVTPLKYENPTLEEVIERLHYTNTQPLWASDNVAKGNRFVG